MVARVNGEERSRGELGDMHFSWDADRRAGRAEHPALPGRRARLGDGRDGLHPRARRRPLAAARRRGRARGRGDRGAEEHGWLTSPSSARASTASRPRGRLQRDGPRRRRLRAVRARDTTRGSSHGRTRIFRLAYPEATWVRLAQEALAGWRELEAESGEELLAPERAARALPRGRASARSRRCASATRSASCSSREEAARRFGVMPDEDALVLFQPDAGVVYADRACARSRGACGSRRTTASSRSTTSTRTVVVVCAGPWARRLLAPARHRPPGRRDPRDDRLLPARGRGPVGRRRGRDEAATASTRSPTRSTG